MLEKGSPKYFEVLNEALAKGMEFMEFSQFRQQQMNAQNPNAPNPNQGLPQPVPFQKK